MKGSGKDVSRSGNTPDVKDGDVESGSTKAPTAEMNVDRGDAEVVDAAEDEEESESPYDNIAPSIAEIERVTRSNPFFSLIDDATSTTASSELAPASSTDMKSTGAVGAAGADGLDPVADGIPRILSGFRWQRQAPVFDIQVVKGLDRGKKYSGIKQFTT